MACSRPAAFWPLFWVTLAAAPPDGAALYQKRCAACHEGAGAALNRAPARSAMARLKPDTILATLASGSMAAHAKGLTGEEMASLASFLTGKTPPAAGEPALNTPTTGACANNPPFDPDKGPSWNGWSSTVDGARSQPASAAGLSAANVGRLKLKWAFGYPNANTAVSQPSIAGGRVFSGSATGAVYSLDLATGCTYWAYQAGGAVRASISIGRAGNKTAAFIADSTAHVHAVDAHSGALLWKVNVDDHPFARLTGSPTLYRGRLYVPVSSHEEVAAGNEKYACCTFRGSLVALDASTGKQLWKTYAIADEPKPAGKNKAGVDRFAPAGAAVWSAPSVDARRGRVYFATGNSYTDVDVPTSDAVIALDLLTGKRIWHRQVGEKDWWNFSCVTPNRANCAAPHGPDYDFGTTPILRDLSNGKSLLIAAQKSGMVYAFDPDRQGEIVWQTKVAQGGTLGGVEWGHAADSQRVYAAVSDMNVKGTVPGGLFALDLRTGAKVWNAPPKPECPQGAAMRACHAAQAAAISAVPGAVFSGAYDGQLRAYATADGSILWSFQTAASFDTVNGIAAKGGSIDIAGPVIAGGMLLTTSGYGTWGGMPGNVLLAFSID